MALARGLDLLGGELGAIDGAFFAATARLPTRTLAGQGAAIDRDPDAPIQALDAPAAADATARGRTGAPLVKRRQALAAPPCGPLKCRAGYRHFPVRGLAKARGECSPMARRYNSSRGLTSIGLKPLLARHRQRANAIANAIRARPWRIQSLPLALSHTRARA